MTNDPIEEFLDKAEKFDRGEFPSIDLSKLLAIVRIYREANDWIIKQPRDQVHFAGSKARLAEQKALEIVK